MSKKKVQALAVSFLAVAKDYLKKAKALKKNRRDGEDFERGFYSGLGRASFWAAERVLSDSGFSQSEIVEILGAVNADELEGKIE